MVQPKGWISFVSLFLPPDVRYYEFGTLLASALLILVVLSASKDTHRQICLGGYVFEEAFKIEPRLLALLCDEQSTT
jgi:hypothetical protein